MSFGLKKHNASHAKIPVYITNIRDLIYTARQKVNYVKSKHSCEALGVKRSAIITTTI